MFDGSADEDVDCAADEDRDKVVGGGLVPLSENVVASALSALDVIVTPGPLFPIEGWFL